MIDTVEDHTTFEKSIMNVGLLDRTIIWLKILYKKIRLVIFQTLQHRVDQVQKEVLYSQFVLVLVLGSP